MRILNPLIGQSVDVRVPRPGLKAAWAQAGSRSPFGKRGTCMAGPWTGRAAVYQPRQALGIAPPPP